MRFSKRTAWEPGENEWAEAARARRASGLELVDLTLSNPTACGLGAHGAELLQPLADPGALHYTPDPLGMPAARAAVATYYHDHQADIAPGRLCLTSSTSEAYSFLFRLLCDPGDEVLIARPSYPLFDLLAALDDVVLREYRLLYEPGAGANGRWMIDLHGLELALTARTRAIVVVHPNNPTGNYAAADERRALQRICADRQIALIVDEVFLDYPAFGGPEPTFAAAPSPCLCFVLSGLSKICALPQMKLSWIATLGPDALVQEAMQRLEVIADTFLSVNAPAQHALPHWLASRGELQQGIRDRVHRNLDALDRRLAKTLASRLSVEGGWTAVLRVPAFVDGEPFAMAAMSRGAMVQPGAFYGLSAGHCVLSLLTAPELWARGLALLPVD